MRRDVGPAQDDFGLALDTFYDRRNAPLFYTNALGKRTEKIVSNEGVSINNDYNPVWDVRTGRFSGRLDGRDADPVQVATISSGIFSGMGRPVPSHDSRSKRMDVPHGLACVDSHPESRSHLNDSGACWYRGAIGKQEHRDQALRHVRPDKQSPDPAHGQQRSHGRWPTPTGLSSGH